jgi:hypothetical protein
VSRNQSLYEEELPDKEVVYLIKPLDEEVSNGKPKRYQTCCIPSNERRAG